MTCPRPDKQAHEAEWQAAAQRQSMIHAGKDVTDLYPYRCRCGKWHLGAPKTPRQRNETLQQKIDYALHGGHHRPGSSKRRKR